jgi:xylulokinase
MSIFLGIDIGTSGTKTLAMDAEGKILADAIATYPCYVPKPLWSEQDPEDWWQATVKSVRKVMRKARLKAADVKAIGLSGQMHGSVFLDKRDKVVRRAILWNDQRTAAECEEIEKRAGGRRKLIKLVANPALTGFTAPKILWLRNHEPRNFDKTCKVLLPKDEIRRRMTGEYATEVSDASGMLLLDVAKRNWSKKLLSALELDAELFAKCYESEDVTGSLTREAARTLGLTTDCILVGGAGDCAAGAVGNGIVNRGVLSTSIGTSGVMFVHCDEVKIDPEGRVHTFCHAVRGKWHMMGVNLSAGGSLQWFRNELCKADMAKAERAKTEVYDLLTKEANQRSGRAGSADPCFRRWFAKPTVAADPGRYLRPQGGYHQYRGRTGLRRGPAGRCRCRRVQKCPRGLRGDDPRNQGNHFQPRRKEVP